MKTNTKKLQFYQVNGYGYFNYFPLDKETVVKNLIIPTLLNCKYFKTKA